MATIATLVVKVMGDASDLKANMASATQDMKRNIDTMKSFGTAMTAGVTLPILGLGAAAIKGAAEQEQLQIAFTTMLGSAEKATNLIQELQQFSAATPFEMPEVVTAGKQLLAFGIAAEDIQPTLTMLGDVASGIGAPVGDLAYLFGTASASGRIMTADINQFANRGIPIIHALAQAMGVADSAVRGMAEKSMISADDMKKAFVIMTKEGSQFGGMMEKQSASINGMMSTLKDNIGQTMTAIGTKLIEILNLGGADGLMAHFLEMTTKIKDGILGFADSFPNVSKLIILLAGLAAAIGPAMLAVGTLAGMLGSGGALAVGFGVASTAISTFISLLLGPVGLAIAAVGLLATAIIKDWGGIGTFLGRVFGTITNVLEGFYDVIVYGQDAFSDFQTFFEQLEPLVGGTAARAITSFGEALWTVRNYIDAVVDAGFDSSESRQAMELLPPALQGIVGWLDKTIFSFVNYGEAVADAGFNSSEARQSLNLFPPAIQGVMRAFNNLASAAGVTFTGLWDIIRYGESPMADFATWFEQLEPLVGGSAANAIVAFGDKLYNLRAAAIATFTGLWDIIRYGESPMADFATWFQVLVPLVGGEVAYAITEFGEGVYSIRHYITEVLTTGNLFNRFFFDLPASIRPTLVAIMQFGATLYALGQYFAAVVTDGDYLNDWLGHLPEVIQPVVQGIGQFISTLLELPSAIGAAAQAIIHYATTGELLGAVEFGVHGHTAAMADAFATLGADIIDKVNQIQTALSTLMSGEDFATLQTSVTASLEGIGTAVHDYFSGDISLGGLAGAVTQGFADIGTAISTFFGGADFGTFLSDIQWSEFIEKLSWENILGTFEGWGTYISNLFWTDVFPVFEGWGAYITSLDWTKIITTAIDWATWIPALSWTAIINVIDWELYITPILWSSFINLLNWADATGEKIDWSQFISFLTWDNFISALQWSGYIVSFTWDSFITKLEWTGAIAKLEDWGAYISTINWTDFIIGVLDWATWIPALVWNEFVDTIQWVDYIANLIWGDSVKPLNWSEFVPAAFAWGDYVLALAWDKYVPAAFSWASYVSSLIWSQFLPAAFAWSSYVFALTWSNFVDKLNWPSLSWPGWSAFIPSFPGWPDIGGMISNMIPDIPGFGGNALGTSNWRGGMTWVGEAGPELVYLPRGSAVDSASESKRRGGDGSGITIGAVYVQDEMDAYTMAYQLDDLRKRRERR